MTHSERALLAGYATGTLPAGQRERVAAHLAGCDTCRADLSSWTAVRAGARFDAPVPPGPEIVAVALRRSVLQPLPALPRHRGPSFAVRLLVAQLRLVRPSIWVASVLVMAFGAVLDAVHANAVQQPLALIAPIVAAAGIAALYGPDRDPAFEIGAATPTSPRLVLLARITLVFGYDLVLALAASVAIVMVGGDVGSTSELIGSWLGPMALLSALSLLLGVWTTPNVAMSVSAGLWVVRVLAGLDSPALGPADWLDTTVLWLWTTSPVTVLLTALLGVGGIVLAGRTDRFRSAAG